MEWRPAWRVAGQSGYVAARASRHEAFWLQGTLRPSHCLFGEPSSSSAEAILSMHIGEVHTPQHRGKRSLFEEFPNSAERTIRSPVKRVRRLRDDASSSFSLHDDFGRSLSL